MFKGFELKKDEEDRLRKEYKGWRPKMGLKTWDGFLLWRVKQIDIPVKEAPMKLLFAYNEQGVNVTYDRKNVAMEGFGVGVIAPEVFVAACRAGDKAPYFEELEPDVFERIEDLLPEDIPNVQPMLYPSDFPFAKEEYDDEARVRNDNCARFHKFHVHTNTYLTDRYPEFESNSQSVRCRERLADVTGGVCQTLTVQSKDLFDSSWVYAYHSEFTNYRIVGAVLEFIPNQHFNRRERDYLTGEYRKMGVIEVETTFCDSDNKVEYPMESEFIYPLECRWAVDGVTDGIGENDVELLGSGELIITVDGKTFGRIGLMGELFMNYEIVFFGNRPLFMDTLSCSLLAKRIVSYLPVQYLELQALIKPDTGTEMYFQWRIGDRDLDTSEYADTLVGILPLERREFCVFTLPDTKLRHGSQLLVRLLALIWKNIGNNGMVEQTVDACEESIINCTNFLDMTCVAERVDTNSIVVRRTYLTQGMVALEQSLARLNEQRKDRKRVLKKDLDVGLLIPGKIGERKPASKKLPPLLICSTHELVFNQIPYVDPG